MPVPTPPDTVGDADAIATNLRNWESRVEIHVDAYDVAAFAADPTRLSDVVRIDLPHLGALAGIDVAHLQCHIGTDTVSLARAGARVVGIDFSPGALAAARELAAANGDDATFVEASVDEVPDVLEPGRFDLVYTSVGVLNWLPSMPRWARTIAHLLRPGGRLYVRDTHPVTSALDLERDDDQLVLRYPYAESGPLDFSDDQTYVGDGTQRLASPDVFEFNHGLGEIVGALLAEGFRVTELSEHFEIDWMPLSQMVRAEVALPDGGTVTRWVLPEGADRLPLEFRLQAVADGGPGRG